MANPEHLEILKQGVKVWNKWREENKTIRPDFSGVNLTRAFLVGANLSQSNFCEAFLEGANLCEANLVGANLSRSFLSVVTLISANLNGADLSQSYFNRANLSGSDLRGVCLRRASLGGSDLSGTDLSKADLSGAYLGTANLTSANLSEANLSESDLSGATLVKTILKGASLSGSKIYGISSWDITVDKKTKQMGLIITQEGQPVITVDNLEVAQFIYLLLNNSKLRDVINTVANKAVLILGRFGERKVILDTIADELRKRDYLPIMFDFDRPLDKTLTETVLTLAGLSKFVIAVMSDPKSTPHEAASIIPIFKIPFVPLIQEDQQVYSMFDDFKLNPWFIKPITYKDTEHIKQQIESLLHIAEEKHVKIRELKAN